MMAKLYRRSLGLVLLLVVSTVQGNEACLEKVFNQYCLGGDINQALKDKPNILHKQREGERFGLIYQHQRDKIYVMAFRNRIYKVLRTQNPASISKYRDLRNRLNKKYGGNKDLSNLPKNARNSAAIVGAIRRGDGEAKHRWRVAGRPWHIELSWTKELGLSVAYIVDSLNAQKNAAEQTGF